MVSCTENPITVNTAVRNNASASQPSTNPRMAATPINTSTSCTSAVTAAKP